MELIRIGLIAWQKPIYQVLGLQTPSADMPKRSSTQPQLLGHFFKQMIKEAS
jgi:hypothetical protein